MVKRPLSNHRRPSRPAMLQLSAQGRLRRCALASGMGLSLLAAPVHAASFGTPGWFAQAAGARSNPSASQASGGAGSTNLGGAVATEQQALVKAQRSIADLSEAARLIAAAQQAQTAAHQLALSQPNPAGVSDGLGANGLQVSSTVDTAAAGGSCGSAGGAWCGADLPTQQVDGGHYDVTVKQTEAKAILTWDKFNVGRNTTLSFDQSNGNQTDGSNDWVALNRVLDASAQPSQILGSIKAQGDVYLINRNGIIFGGSAQVDTHSLLASSMALLSTDIATSNSRFLASGLSAGISGSPDNSTATLLIGEFSNGHIVNGDITIEQGAQISTGQYGYSLIAAPNVSNAGTISANDGQVILAATAGMGLQDLPNTSYGTSSNLLSPYIANQYDKTDPHYHLSNTGLIQATRSNITLLGVGIDQDGVVGVTTGVAQPGSIQIRSGYNVSPKSFYGTVHFGGQSLTAVLPEHDGQTTTSSGSATAAFEPGSISASGASLTFESCTGSCSSQTGALLEAPGATVSLSAINVVSYQAGVATTASNLQESGDTSIAGRIYVDDGATIDVSGIADIQQTVQDTLVTIGPLTQNELADSPLLRDSFLFTSTVTVDSTLSGTRADGEQWQGSPIISASAYIQNIPRDIDELLVNGGTLTLSAPEVITRSGSLLQLDGGYIDYQGGQVSGTTKLLGADGRIYDIGSADPDMLYVGIAGQYVDRNAYFNVTRTYTDPLLSGALTHEEPGFVQGGKAGTLNVSAATAVLDGSISAQAYAGARQVASGSQPAGGSFVLSTQRVVDSAGNQISLPVSSIVVTEAVPELAAGFDSETTLASINPSTNPEDTRDLQWWTPVGAEALTAAGFASIKLQAADTTALPAVGARILVDSGVTLSVAPGGSISLYSGQIDVNGNLSARSGQISLSTTLAAGPTLHMPADGSPAAGDIHVADGVTLDVSGLWVNDAYRSPDEISGSRYVNGGSITLKTAETSTLYNGSYVDTTGSIVLGSGSVLNASSGGYVTVGGTLASKNGVAQGKGGSISLSVYDESAAYFGDASNAAPLPEQQATRGKLVMDGSLLAYGFSDGGSLSLRALGFQIGGDAADAPSWSTVLPASFFTGAGAAQGFGSYTLSSIYDTVVSSGTQLRLSQQNWLPDVPALLQTPSGSALLASGAVSLGSLDDFHRSATNLSLSAGAYLNWNQGLARGNKPLYQDSVQQLGSVVIEEDASIIADAGASIALTSPNRVEVLGSVVAHGGDISLHGGNTHVALGSGATVPTPIPGQPVSVLIGPDALLDVSGVALINTLVDPVAYTDGSRRTPQAGTVLDGGSVELYGSGQVLVQAGAVIDASGVGAADDPVVLDLPTASGRYAPRQVWSDAGSITLSAGTGLYMDGTLKAVAGSGVGSNGQLQHGEGGSLSIIGLYGADALILQAAGSANLIPDDWTLEQAIPGVSSDTLYFNVDRLSDSGITSLDIGSNSNPANTVATPGNFAIGFAGDVQLSLDRAFVADASREVALADGALAVPASAAGINDLGATQVDISAPYVSLSGYYGTGVNAGAVNFDSTPVWGSAQLNISADFIDLGGAFALQNFADAAFTSSGAIRFVTPEEYEFGGNATDPLRGALYTPGNLTFTAAELYPATNNAFAVVANAQGLAGLDGQPLSTTIDIRPNGDSTVPLSAGGMLLLDAGDIVQAGTIRAPAGSVVLGVGDPDAAATQALFNPGNVDGDNVAHYYDLLPLVATHSVALAPGSLTSVSVNGATIPYGVTVDGQEWQYNESQYGNQTQADLSAPPEKQVLINAANIDLQAVDGSTPAAQIDLSGGGTLQAAEWVPGVGGSRNLLSQYNTSYATSLTGTQVPLYPDQRGVYALVPSYEAPVAAYDAVYSNGQAPIAAGQTITISAGAGIPAGTYVLMPAQYATLRGAYRVVENTGATDAVASQNAVLPDGTMVVSGYYGDALSGASAARSTQFLIQSRDTWNQYSAYTYTSADTFFSSLAGQAGSVTPQLPMDAGHLVLGAIDTLGLGASLATAPADGGALAQVDIASQYIQINGGGASALAGYLQLDATELDALNAGSLLIGGTRSQTSTGTGITPLADSLVVSNDEDSALSGPEILLVTTAGGSGLQLQSGSVIRASGSVPDGSDKPITIGSSDVPGSGDGALLMVSNGTLPALTRLGSTGAGVLGVAADATIDGGQVLLLDSAGDTLVDSAALLSGEHIALDARSISFVAAGSDASAEGLVIGADTLAQFASAQTLSLRSYGNIDFEGDVDLSVANDLSLSAGDFTAGAWGDAGDTVSLQAATLTLANELGAAGSSGAAGDTALQLGGTEVDFGSAARGKVAFSGFASVAATAGAGIVGRGGSFDFGSLPVSLSAPVVLAGADAKTSLSTTGSLNLASTSGTPLQGGAAEIGGELDLVGGSIVDDGTLSAPSGTLSLRASSGDVQIGSAATLSVAGVGKQFFDLTEYAPGGAISLRADHGNVEVQPGALLDFSADAGGGNAGSLTIAAPGGSAAIAGTLQGGASPGNLGGAFSLNVGSAVDLNSLAATLAASGVGDSIAVSSGSGDLVLGAGNSLTARSVSLIADAGDILIDGSIIADGTAGGSIALYGKTGVDVEGRLEAKGSAANERGGDIDIGTAGHWDGTLNADYGYENMDPTQSGVITVGAGAVIDVSGGTKGGLSGGTVNLRAPLLGNGDVNLNVADTATVSGARSVTLEAYAVWSTTDPVIDPAKHFDGIIDPAGWFDASGNRVAGSWVDENGTPIAAADADPGSDYFAASAPDTAHQTFYGYVDGDAAQGAGTLMRFIQQLGGHAPLQARVQAIAAHLANFRLVPGIELDNPDTGINSGNVSLLSNWNLGATDALGNAVYRYGGAAPVLTVRAANNVDIVADLSDGFVQNSAGPNLAYSAKAYASAGTSYTSTSKTVTSYASTGAGTTIKMKDGSTYYVGDDSGYAAYAAPSDGQSASYYSNYNSSSQNYSLSYGNWARSAGASGIGLNGKYTVSPAALASGAPSLSAYPQTTDGYAAYAAAYLSWLKATFPASARAGLSATPPAPEAPTIADPAQYASYLSTWNSYYGTVNANLDGGSFHSGTVFVYIFPPQPPVTGDSLLASSAGGNDPANVRTTSNVDPTVYATLAGGSSSSYRLVAGADFSSTDPLALAPAADFESGGGDVTLGGYAQVVDEVSTLPNSTKLLDRTLVFPTTVRTGSGSIDIAAGGDFSLTDDASAPAPGVVYTAGVPKTGTTADGSVSLLVLSSNTNSQVVTPELVVTGSVNPDAAGDLSITAQGDIRGDEQIYDNTGSITGVQGAYIAQFWWPWMQTGNQYAANGSMSASSINFGAFDQGILSLGGNVNVQAGGDIRELSVSLPTTWNLALDASGAPVSGGGNLTVSAGGDILGGSYFVAQGSGRIAAGGSLASAFTLSGSNLTRTGSVGSPVSTILALQDAVIDVSAHQDLNLGAVVNPSDLDFSGFYTARIKPDLQAYGSGSAVYGLAVSGKLSLNTLGLSGELFSYGNIGGASGTPMSSILPANLQLTALNDGIDVAGGGSLYPSATGQLSLIAEDTINLSCIEDCASSLGMYDISTGLPSPTDQSATFSTPNSAYNRHQSTALHADDPQPVYIYSLSGDIFGGYYQADGFVHGIVSIDVPKAARIYAGQDIVNLNFTGQNLALSDVTRIVAGRDLYDTPMYSYFDQIPEALVLGGPGTFDVEAGRNLGPISHQGELAGQKIFASNLYLTGIDAVGNANNPYLPHQSADVQALFGVAPSLDAEFNLDIGAFIVRYIGTPGSAEPGVSDAGDGVPDYTDALVAFMETYEAGLAYDTGYVKDQQHITLTPEQSWAAFQALPGYQQQRFAFQVFNNLLAITGQDYNDKTSPYYHQYARGYEAVNTLFPPALGYTQNALGGGSNGSNAPVTTGNLDLRGSTIQTQQGGNILLYGPGGQALLSSASAPPQLVDIHGNPIGLNTQGILTLEQGDIDIFTDQSLLLAQSRIFTEQGGNLLIWSSNGDINAGNGLKSTAYVPPLLFTCDPNHYCILDPSGEVTGAGIATLQTTPDTPPGDVELIAPRGTVDAGNAGIRVSGNLTVAAQHVANVYNIEVKGSSIGVPMPPHVDTGALTAASAAATAAMQAAALNPGAAKAATLIDVQVVGYGMPDEEQKRRLRQQE